jgi:hypothetical protein
MYLCIYLGKETRWLETLKLIAYRKGKSLSSLIRDIILEYLSNNDNDFAIPKLDDDPYVFFQNQHQLDEERIAEIWRYARQWLSRAEYELQKRRGGIITIKRIEIP